MKKLLVLALAATLALASALTLGQQGPSFNTRGGSVAYSFGTWTPVVTAASGTITTVGAVSGTWTKIGRICHVFFNIVITTNGTGAGTLLVAGMPFNLSGTTAFGSAFEFNVGGLQNLVAYNSATQLRLNNSAGTYPASNGSGHRGGATYEC